MRLSDGTIISLMIEKKLGAIKLLPATLSIAGLGCAGANERQLVRGCVQGTLATRVAGWVETCGEAGSA